MDAIRARKDKALGLTLLILLVDSTVWVLLFLETVVPFEAGFIEPWIYAVALTAFTAVTLWRVPKGLPG